MGVGWSGAGLMCLGSSPAILSFRRESFLVICLNMSINHNLNE